MHTNKSFILLIFIFLAITSCTTRPPKKEVEKEEGSQTLNETKTFIKSRGSYNEDIIESLYKEILAKNVPLQQLEAEMDSINAKNNKAENEPLHDLNVYNQKSATYYASAEGLASQITDSLLRKKLLAILENSKESAAQKVKEHTSLIAQMAENQSNIHNQHLAMKILLTLPVIEKYQTKNIPDTKELVKLTEQQKKLILKMENAVKQ